MVERFSEILKINGKPPSQKAISDKRLARIDEALSWSGGTFLDKHHHEIWSGDEYSIRLGKPGKEAARESGYKGELNQNDMRPDIFKNGVNLNLAATFGDVVADLEAVARVEKYCVELLGVLFFRSAFLLDHQLVTLSDGRKAFRYCPSVEVVDYITQRIPTIYGIPPIVFLQYLDAIALNEDVKYHTKGKDLTKVATGAKNNYLTYVQIIAVITGEMPVSVLAKKLLRTNVSAISVTDGLRVLPHVAE